MSHRQQEDKPIRARDQTKEKKPLGRAKEMENTRGQK